MDRINNDMYYVPVTKYINDDREKIKIIVEELASSYLYEGNLISFLNSNTVLLDYQDDDGIMRLNFNDYIMDGNDKLVEEVIYTISLSVFDNLPCIIADLIFLLKYKSIFLFISFTVVKSITSESSIKGETIYA